MYQPFRTLLMLAISTSLAYTAIAQTDSTAAFLDMGRISLKKEFTQSITIKGEQLEKMPFSTLNEAINSWLFGFYSNASTAYIIDGVLMNDVNAYSIYDIAEITLVQNALIRMNGIRENQPLIVITTRKGGPDKKGITVAAQSFLVNQEKQLWEPGSSENNFYHQLQASAWQNHRFIQYGVSLNYLREVYPALKNDLTKQETPKNFDRFRINAWMKTQLDANNELVLQVNTVPQIMDWEDITYKTPDTTSGTHNTSQIKTFSFNPSLQFRSRFLKNWHNTFKAAYHTSKVSSENESNITNIIPFISNTADGTRKLRNLLLSDEISYQGAMGNWHIEPAVQISYRRIRQMEESTYIGYSGNNPGSIHHTEENLLGKFLLFTPSVNLYYKDIFNVQGGLLYNASKKSRNNMQRGFPFASTSIEVLKLAGKSGNTSLQLFGSYAVADNYGDGSFSLTSYPVVTNDIYFSSYLAYPYYIQSPDKAFTTWQAGAKWSLLQKRLSIGYNYEDRDYMLPELFSLPTPTGITNEIRYVNYTSTTHAANITFQVKEQPSFSWLTSFTMASVKNLITKTYEPGGVLTGYGNVKPSFSGGFTNRFSFHKVSAGIDLLYYFTHSYYIGTVPGPKVNSLSLQNIYVGYKVSQKGIKGLELYIACRNLSQHETTSYQLGGNRKFYGVGGKINL